MCRRTAVEHLILHGNAFAGRESDELYARGAHASPSPPTTQGGPHLHVDFRHTHEHQPVQSHPVALRYAVRAHAPQRIA
jgi:hypothetical protein